MLDNVKHVLGLIAGQFEVGVSAAGLLSWLLSRRLPFFKCITFVRIGWRIAPCNVSPHFLTLCRHTVFLYSSCVRAWASVLL